MQLFASTFLFNWALPITIVIVLGAALLFLAINLMSRKNRKLRQITLDKKVYQTQKNELEWYREKRFLMERQAQEKHDRIVELIAAQSPEKSHHLTYSASQLFLLAESIREERQQLGTDTSKLIMIDQRLKELSTDLEDTTKISACRNSIKDNREQLRKAQDLLRKVLANVVELEDKARENELPSSDFPKAIDTLNDIKSRLEKLPDDLKTVAKTTGEEASTLLEKISNESDEQLLHQIWQERLDLDLFSSEHRPGGKPELINNCIACIEAFDSVNKQQVDIDLKASILNPDPVEPEDTTNPVEQLIIEDQIITDEKSDDDNAEIKTDQLNTLFTSKEATSEPVDKRPNSQTFFFGDTKSSHPKAAEGYRFKGGKQTSESRRPPLTSNPKSGYVFGKSKQTEPEPDESLESQLTNPEEPVDSDRLWQQPNFGLDEIIDEPPTQEEPEIVNRPSEENPFNPFTSVEKSDSDDSPSTLKMVIFRANNPEIWNTHTHDENQLSKTLSEISDGFGWMGIKRLDTGEEVFAEVTLSELKGDGEGKSAGFNGSNEFFYGARHLGFFSEQCATEVETRFTYGGWGFGHLAASDGNEDEPFQSCAWNGQRIADNTIFEFTIYENRPEHAQEDQIIV